MNMKGLLDGRGEGATQAPDDVADAATEAAARDEVTPHDATSTARKRAWPVNRLRRFTDALKAPDQIAGVAGAAFCGWRATSRRRRATA